MTNAAFRATYSDLRLVKGRKVLQLVFEVPLEASNSVLAILGGMPNPAAEVWCAVARLDPSVVGAAASAAGLSTTIGQRETQGNPGGGYEVTPDNLETSEEGNALDEPTPRRSRNPVEPENRLAQRAGILCNDPMFHRYLGKKHHIQQSTDRHANNLLAAAFVRQYCNVETRADIKPNTEAATRLDLLESAFVCWRDAPEYEGVA